VIDPSSDSADLAPGTRLDLPLWMVPPMAGRNMLQARRGACSCDACGAKVALGMPSMEDCRCAAEPYALKTSDPACKASGTRTDGPVRVA